MLKDLALWAGVCALAPATSFAQLTFTNSTPLMSASNSGGCMGVVDMNGDGLDDIAKLDNARTFVVDYQNTDGSFTTVNYGSVSGSGQWGMAIADMDNNGHKDLVSGGSYDGTHYLRISSIGNGTLSTLNGGTIFTQGMSIGDMDNNGRLDVYACHDDGPPSLWFTNASGVPVNSKPRLPTPRPTPDMKAKRWLGKWRATNTVQARNAGAQPTPISSCPSISQPYCGAQADSAAPITVRGKALSTVRRSPTTSAPGA